jgi:type IV secretory pathway TraG/TraD family ATPase VirD4
MNVFIIILIIIFVLMIVSTIPIFYYVRKLARDKKNYERGLKMVTFLIHIPPMSEDVESNGRDTRDVTEESISQAQIMYNILSSSYRKGFRDKFYGQRHFSIEIIGSGTNIYFYTSVPVSLIDLVKQSVISSYPSAVLEEVEDHNIFNKIGKINSTTGGELILKEDFAFPIATYQDLKRDAIQSLLNSLSNLTDEDGIGIQILLRPANQEWRKEAAMVASEKKKGKSPKASSDIVFEWAKHLAIAFYKVPDAKEDASKDKKELSSTEQSIVEAIEDKTRHPGFEVCIRLVASSNINQRAQSLISNITAAFTLFESQGKNGFKYQATDDIENFVTNYILRTFPAQKKRNILNSVELSTLFHFPDQRNIPTSQLKRQNSKQVDGPRDMPDQGLLLGYNIFRGIKKPIRISQDDRRRHIYTLGQTGTGKTTLLENLALQDMINGNGFAFIDPHGDIADKLLSMVPKERAEDVIYFNPSDTNNPLGLNLFEFKDQTQKDFLVQESINMIYKLYDPNRQGIVGPRFEQIFRNSALLLMSDPGGATFIDVPKTLTDPQYVREKLKYVTDQTVIDFWTREWPASQKSNDSGEVTSWVNSKFGQFLSNQMMRNIIGQNKSSFNLRDIMDNKKILLVNLSKGLTGELNSKLLGMIFVMKFQMAAMSRSDIPDIDDRVDFCLYVDEFQNFSTDSFADVMSEARKFRLNLIVANQFTTQLTDEIRAAVFGNVGTIVAFRIGQDDTGPLKQYFQPTFDEDDLLRLPTGDTIVRTLVNGVPTAPFSMTTLMPQGHTNPKLGEALKQLSAAKFGRPKAEVDEEITRRVYSVNSSSLNPLMNPNTKINQPSSQSIKPASNSSFLDQWLAKKNQQKPIKPISNTPNSLPASDQNNNLNEDIPVVNNPIAPKNYQQPSSFDNYQSQSSFSLAPDKAQAEEVQNIIQQEPIPKNEGHIDLNSDEKLDHVFHVNND